MILCWGLRRLGLKKESVLVMKLGVKVGIGEAGKEYIEFLDSVYWLCD